MKVTEEKVETLKKHLSSVGIEKPSTLQDCLEQEGQQALVGRKFFGYDNDYGRQMIYRVDEYNHNNNHPMLTISELTVFPRARVFPALSMALHLDDVEVTQTDLKETAEALGLETKHFHLYL